MITAVLIDDEPKSTAILKNKIDRYCPEIEIVGNTQDPREAKELIAQSKPDLLFLDVAMPGMSGFDVLAEFDKPTFEIIFVTAFDSYAIEAIRYCAIGYLVKPVDKAELIEAVANAKANIDDKSALKKNRQLLENLEVKAFQDKKIILPTHEGLEFIAINQILCCEGVDGYTKIYIKDQKPMLSSSSIGHFKTLFANQEFYLVHKSHLVNLNYIDRYLNEGYVVIGERRIPVSRNRRSDFITVLKNA